MRAIKTLRPYLKIILLGIVLLANSMTAFAMDPPPLIMLKEVTKQMVTELDRNLGHLKGNEALVSGIVRRLLLPHVDVENMSQMVIGRTYWQQANSQIQQQFIEQFTKYVIKTYAGALYSYDGEIIEFYPIRGYTPDQIRVQVNSNIHHKNQPSNQMQYRVINKNNVWLVYDFSVDGVSFVQNYRAQFASTLQQGGLSLLVQKLIEKNK